MYFKLPKKFTDREIDDFINEVYDNFNNSPKDKYFFDLTEVEYIGNQELLLLTALFQSFVEAEIDFEISFFKKGIPTYQIAHRVKKQIVQFWYVWKIWKIIPNEDFDKYFGIDGNTVQRLKNEINYSTNQYELYTRYGVTPFVKLEYIHNYDETEVRKIIGPIYKLNAVVESLLNDSNCHHPFTSESLSTILTEELYLNFLDHSINSSFSGFINNAYMSISFQNKFPDLGHEEVQKLKKINFQSECLDETLNFYFDKKTNQFKNTPYIQFSFIDFGQGIANTLRDEYQVNNPEKSSFSDSDVLRYAFNHDSSRHPIEENKSSIPRGLFDAITIVKRYKGLLVIRSNNGKILFDFSSSDDLDKAFNSFGNSEQYFPGTLISLYLPAVDAVGNVNVSTIKPEIAFSTVKPESKSYISVSSILESIENNKEYVYNSIHKALRVRISESSSSSLFIVSFKGCETVEKRVIKKILYFLLTDYNINYLNNVIIVHPPNKEHINEVEAEILSLSDAIKNYKVHPLPIVDFNVNTEDVDIRWLGVYDESDKQKLNDLLYEQYSIAKSDFNDPTNVVGQLNAFDNYGNLRSNLPNKTELLDYYYREDEILSSFETKRLLKKHNCIKSDTGKHLYLCNGNYYQKEYLELNSLVSCNDDINKIALLLFDKIKKKQSRESNYKFIGITTTSQRILKSLELQGLIQNDSYITLDNYYTFEQDLTKEIVNTSCTYILICDVISTGFLTYRLNKKLNQLGTKIEYIGTIASILDKNFDETKEFLNEFEERIITLYDHSIAKFRRADIREEILAKNIIRINPHTNIPITISINETNYYESVIFHSIIDYEREENNINIENGFLNYIDSDAINVGFFKFNNVIHPYFFKTELILKDISIDFLDYIFKKINNDNLQKNNVKVFYPRKSGIEALDFNLLKRVLNNHSIEEVEIDRFGTPDGWRFPHNTEFLHNKIDESYCLILDDGSCSGDSLIQMIDEISFYSAKEIIVISFIGRVNDHKREFFSRISNIRGNEGSKTPLAIYFACHWHIPTFFLDENPNTRETYWLQEIISFNNTPQSIKRIAKNIISEIKPKSKEKFKDYKFLPKSKINDKIPKKELLLVREEIGKVIGYRLYRESFRFFDLFIKKYEDFRPSIDRYKEIELLCATLIYEPYLYPKIITVIPDVAEKVEEFVRALIYKNQQIFELLTYKWDKKDIVHLFFIVFFDEKLVNELTIQNFKNLIAFTQQTNSTVNYILYRLLKYFPLSKADFELQKFDSQLKKLIVQLKDDTTIPNIEIIKYYNFITSLPSRDDINSQLTRLNEIYKKENEKEYHDEKKSFNHNVSLFIVTVREIIKDLNRSRVISDERLNTVKESWFKIQDFIVPILTFSSSYKEFLAPYTYGELVKKCDSLRDIVGFIEDAMYSDNEYLLDIEKLSKIKEYITKIQSDFQLNSIFHQLIQNTQSNVVEFIDNLKDEIGDTYKIRESGSELNKHKAITDIPQLYIDKLLVSELSTNIKKYSRPGDDIYFFITYSGTDTLVLEIENSILQSDSATSNGEGIKCIKLLSNYSAFGFNYASIIEENKFKQTLTFNIRLNGN